MDETFIHINESDTEYSILQGHAITKGTFDFEEVLNVHFKMEIKQQRRK